MFDTHAHVHDAVFDPDRDEMLQRARAAGIDRIMTIGTDLADSRRAGEAAAAHALTYAMGIHPHEAEDAPPDVAAGLDAVRAACAFEPAAVGEIGLDYFYAHSPRDVQRRVLVEQFRYALDRGYPTVFHQRDAFDDFMAILREHGAGGIRGVIHCFTGTADQARAYIDEFDLYLGIGGVLTFKNAQQVRDAVVAVGLERIILETDCPYLAPIPFRGKRNEPAYMAATATRLSELLDVPYDEVVARTDRNARALFGG